MNGPMVLIYLAALLLLITIVGAVGDDRKQQQAELDLYCHMVGINKNDNDHGWPDYKGIYEEECTDER